VQMLLKCADIGHLAADVSTHKRWAYQLEEEFFRQVSTPPHLLVCKAHHALVLCLLVLCAVSAHTCRTTCQLAGKHSFEKAVCMACRGTRRRLAA